MKYAFSLVELSIVLVILGLLTGGILGGQALIRASELRKVSTDIAGIQTATFAFRGKYLALPGDMTNATAFWQIQAGTTGNDDTCYLSSSTDARTCNGNGDGRILGGYSSTGHHERGRFWQHLANAGLVEGQYTGVHGLTAAESRVGGQNAKKGPFSNTHYNVAYINAIPAGNPSYYAAPDGNIVEVTRDFPAFPEPPRDLFLGQEAWGIDLKMDDEMPGTGGVRGPMDGSTQAPDCTIGTNAATATYDLLNSSKTCFMLFYLKI